MIPQNGKMSRGFNILNEIFSESCGPLSIQFLCATLWHMSSSARRIFTHIQQAAMPVLQGRPSGARGRPGGRGPRGNRGNLSPSLAALDSPLVRGGQEKSLPLTREVAFAKQMTEGEIGWCGRARRFVAPHAQRASPGERQGRTLCAPTWWRAGRPLIRPSVRTGPPSPQGEGTEDGASWRPRPTEGKASAGPYIIPNS